MVAANHAQNHGSAPVYRDPRLRGLRDVPGLGIWVGPRSGNRGDYLQWWRMGKVN